MNQKRELQKKQAIPEDFRPYVPLGLYLSDEFKKFVTELLFLIREYGISKHPAAPENHQDWLNFSGFVHEGWKQAQSLIAKKILENLTSVEKLTKDIPLGNEQNEIRRLNLEIKILRRMQDSIAWSVLLNEHSTIRRLSVKGGEHNFSAANIADALPIVDEYNSVASNMAILTDLTTFVHNGDVLLFDAEKGAKYFIELKSGEKNHLLTEMAQFAVESECPKFNAHVTSALPPKDFKQFERVKRQYGRAKTVTETINNEMGSDPNTGAKVSITTVPTEFEGYQDKIVRCCGELGPDKIWAIDSVDDCLFLGAYAQADMAYVGFNPWMDLIKCTSPVYNLTDTFADPSVKPFASLNLPLEILTKILKSEVCVVLSLDLNKFIFVGNKLFPNMFSLGGAKESRKAFQQPLHLAECDGRIIKATAGGQTITMGTGIIERIIYDFQSPVNAIMHLRDFLETKQKNGDIET